jgi:LacI family transcriptional regulator
MVTSVDVAKHLGLSQSTVSRALRGDPAVAPSTKERVLSGARELGYVPDAAARMMVTRRTHAVGIVVADLTSPIYPVIVESLQNRLLERGYRMVLIRDPDISPDPEAVDVLDRATVDGMIFVSAREGSAAVRRVLDRGTPVVLLSRDDVSVDVEAVLAEDRGAGELVISHLHKLGHTRIGVLSTLRDRSNGRDREDGVRAAMERRGIPLREDWVQHLRLTHEDGVRAALEMLDRQDRPTALFCVTDAFAFAALDAAAQLGLRVPDELSIVGFDDSGPSRWAFVNLTTVHQPIAEMSYEAVDRLAGRIEGEPPSQTRKPIFPVRLEIRGTTAPPPQAVLRPPLKSSV